MMKNIKKIVALGLGFMMIASFTGCGKETSTKTGSNKMSTDFVYTDKIGVAAGSKDCSDKINEQIEAGNSICFGDGTYYFSEPIKLKNAQLIGTGNTNLVATGDAALIEADGCFVITDVSMYNNTADGTEKQGEKVLVQLGKNGGVTEGSQIYRTQFGKCGTGIYEASDATPTQGLDMDTLEFTRVVYAGMDFQSKGRKNNHIGNVYMGSIGSSLNDYSEVGARFSGSEENLTIDQFNMEHYRAATSFVFNNVKNLDISTIHIEGMDIAKASNGYIECNNTSGNLGNVVVYWSRVSYENSSCILLGEADKEGNDLFIEAIQMKGVNDPASFHGSWPNRGIKDNGYRMVDRIDGSKNEYRVTVDNYVPFTYQNDWETLSSFPCDDEDIVFLKKGNIKEYGTTEERPTKCLCNGYSKYYDTTLEQLLVYNGETWEPYVELNVSVSAEE